VEILGKDILPIHTELNVIRNAKKKVLSVFSLLLFIIPIFIYLTAFMIKIKAGNKEEGFVLARRKNAYRVFKKNISLASGWIKSLRMTDFPFISWHRKH